MPVLNWNINVYGMPCDCHRCHPTDNRFRQTNLTLLQTYGPNAWRTQNYLLENTAKQVEQALEELKELTVEVNRSRKNNQVMESTSYSWTVCWNIHLD